MTTDPISPPILIASSPDAIGEQQNEVKLTRITTAGHALATKHFLILNGKVERRTVADITHGRVEVKTVAGLAGFAALLASLRTDQCLVYGMPRNPPAELVTETEWAKLGRPVTHVARTKDAFSWSNGPGVLMFDYDAPKDGGASLDRDSLVAAVRSACPALATARMLWWPSTSSCIRNTATGEEVSGIKGQRLYLLVRDARDIERAGKALLERLWAGGHGRFEVSKSGALLERGLFDASVWQTNRIDFAAGALCTEPLVQERGVPVLVEGGDEIVDSFAAIPDPSAEVSRAASARKRDAREAARTAADAARESWVESRAAALVDEAVPQVPTERREQAIAEAKSRVRRAVEQDVLPGDWTIQFSDGTHARVLDILDHPAKYHGRLTLDPIEPDYDGRRAVGKLFLYSARPSLYSFAHGGRTFRLDRQLERIELVRGKAHETVNAFLAAMRAAPDVFDFGGALVTVDGAMLKQLNEHTVRYWLGGHVQCFTLKKGKGEGELVEQIEDPPLINCKAIVDLGHARGLKQLKAIVTAPTIRPDGTVMSESGFDDETGLLVVLDGEEARGRMDRPTRAEAEAALALLWRPFERFPFVGPLDRAAHLAAVLTAIVRPGLPTAPAFAYDAPAQGSGKTLLAQCVAALAAGEMPDVWPPAKGRDDEENRKRLLTALAGGKRAVLIDNLIGTFDSPSLASALTSEMYADRVLGSSTECRVPNRAVFLLSGNNLALSGDMPRRTLTCRIDPRCEAPYAREFDLDPKAYCLGNRQAMAVAALTLVRFYLSAGVARPGAGRMASFERWDDVVRQTVLYADRELAPGQFGDVMDIVRLTSTNDAEVESLGQLLGALRSVYGAGWFTAASVHEAITSMWSAGSNDPKRLALAEIVKDLIGMHGAGAASAKSIGRILRHRRDRLASGLRLEHALDQHRKVARWRVTSSDDDAPSRATVLPWARSAVA